MAVKFGNNTSFAIGDCIHLASATDAIAKTKYAMTFLSQKIILEQALDDAKQLTAWVLDEKLINFN